MTFFDENARECILSILSVLEVTKVQTKASAKHEKSSKTQKNFLAGQKSLLDISKQNNLRMKRLLKEVATLKMLLFSMTVVRRVVEMIVLAVTQEVDSDCKD